MPKTSLNASENDILKHDNSFNVQFVKTGDRPQNFIKNVDPSCRYVKYPRTAQLMQEKNAWVKKRSHPPVYIQADLEGYDLSSLGKFDIIYCDPPWEEYEKRAKRLNLYSQNSKYYKSWSLESLKKLPVGEIADSPSFIFLWAGCEHLEDARELLKEWGFKRCEDITWVKTNLLRKKVALQSEEGIFVRVKEHCLMGYKGDSKRAFDHTFIHPNIDIDVIITEQPETGSLAKPIQMYDIIERFCLGRRKIELFGCTSNIRSGWLTIGSQLLETKFNLQEYNSWFQGEMEGEGWKGGRLMGTTIGIQGLRPKEEGGSMRSMEDQGKRSLAKSDSSKF